MKLTKFFAIWNFCKFFFQNFLLFCENKFSRIRTSDIFCWKFLRIGETDVLRICELNCFGRFINKNKFSINFFNLYFTFLFTIYFTFISSFECIRPGHDSSYIFKEDHLKGSNFHEKKFSRSCRKICELLKISSRENYLP